MRREIEREIDRYTHSRTDASLDSAQSVQNQTKPPDRCIDVRLLDDDAWLAHNVFLRLGCRDHTSSNTLHVGDVLLKQIDQVSADQGQPSVLSKKLRC